MKTLLILFSFFFLVAGAAGQEFDLPYAQGNVKEFLKECRNNDQPSIVLYNFNLESG